MCIECVPETASYRQTSVFFVVCDIERERERERLQLCLAADDSSFVLDASYLNGNYAEFAHYSWRNLTQKPSAQPGWEVVDRSIAPRQTSRGISIRLCVDLKLARTPAVAASFCLRLSDTVADHCSSITDTKGP